MPNHLPSSFASAAAGQNANRPGGGGRGTGDWYVETHRYFPSLFIGTPLVLVGV